MSSSQALRPGIALGSYPERTAPRDGVLDRIARQLRGALGRRHTSLAALREIAARVETRRQALRPQSDAALAGVRDSLRGDLLRSGLDGEVAIRAFALVCESARRTLGMDPYPVQVMGGWVMLQGMLAEMETGEGKTLAAALPACTAALAGIPVHVITVNDYLVERDAALLQPLYGALGLRVGTVIDADPDPARHRAAYACDVTYATNKQVAFDYLRDRLVRGDRRARLRSELRRAIGGDASQPVMRGLCYALVDEADSVLIDEARTPLLLARDVRGGDLEKTCREALALAALLSAGRDYSVDLQGRRVQLTPAGAAELEARSRPMGGLWAGRRRREELVGQALSARLLFRRDEDYVLRDQKIVIVDANTGRVMPDRSWEAGLHQMIEVKEGCPITGQRETLARISFQRFYRRYLRLAGMTGTAREVVGELRAVYGLDAVRIPTRLPCARRALATRVLASSAGKWDAVTARIAELQCLGQPVLVGTRSVAASERLSALLRERRLEHQVLNARQDAHEAEIVARAGQRGCITIATNMAGRGTDIELGPGVRELGGLHVIATEYAEARRIDRQLFGRCARQGDPGSYERIVALDDEAVRSAGPAGLLPLLAALLARGGRPGRRVCELWIARTQRAAEARSQRLRRNLIGLEEYLDRALSIAGSPE